MFSKTIASKRSCTSRHSRWLENLSHQQSYQPYAATNKANEPMVHTYSNLNGSPTTELRFFTVYRPWGRPDMALYIFAKVILEVKPIQVLNNRKMKRDTTYIDGFVEALVRQIDCVPSADPAHYPLKPDASTSNFPCRVFTIGNSAPVELERFVTSVEDALGVHAIREYLPMEMGDVPETYADVKALEKLIDFKPRTSNEDGMRDS